MITDIEEPMYSIRYPRELSKSEVQKCFDKLLEIGVVKFVATYSGGNDDGGVTEYTLYNNEYKIVYEDLEMEWPNLYEKLTRPIYLTYNSFAFEFTTSGTLTWKENKVFIEGEEVLTQQTNIVKTFYDLKEMHND